MKRGRPFEPGNRYGRGRPPGSRNRSTLAAQEILDAYGVKVVSKALTKALQGKGSSTMIRTLLPHVVSKRKDAMVRLPRMPFRTTEDLNQASEAVLKRVFAGKVSPADAQIIYEMIDKRRHVIETYDLDRRVRLLEGAQSLPAKSDSSHVAPSPTSPLLVSQSEPPVEAIEASQPERNSQRPAVPDDPATL